MNHIELALSVISSEIVKLKSELERADHPEVQEEIMSELQKLNRAVNEIKEKFNVM